MTYAPRRPDSLPTPVPYDRDLEPGLAAFLEAVEGIPLRADTIEVNREHFASTIPAMEEMVDGRAVTVTEHLVPGPAGAPEVAVTVISPAGAGTSRRPGFFGIHGGGLILGTRYFGAAGLVDYVLEFDVVAATVEYRLAPEDPGPAQAEDCYAGLAWFASHAEELGVDPAKIVVMGDSAGGGLSAAMALMARDRQGPALAGQLLGCPMLDDRNETVSSWQYDGIGAWDRNNNDCAWDAVLGDRRGTDAVSPYEAPARATDLAGLPPAFIEVGAAEVFRDEAVAYASGIWAAGGQAELHVWSGGFHGFSGLAADAPVSRAATATRASWLQRILCGAA